MSDILTPKTNAWTDEAKNELLLRIIAQLKPEGKSINWNEITMEGRTMKSLQNQWTAFNKKIDALKQQAADAPSPPAKKTPGRKRGPKPKTPKMVGSDEDDDYESLKKSTPRKRRAPKTEIDDENSTKAIKMEINETIKAEDGEFDHEV
ncbi:hypothetical protein FPOA_07780 [Fusarium poae]|uniref:Myb-like domain-containing protein n=1 Tax=Fusarium poae TaxID=36050 RepID=A0A1B8ALN2_FUSPO|nr:hypothetical protein FPOA_07780 [Fusarium poae]